MFDDDLDGEEESLREAEEGEVDCDSDDDRRRLPASQSTIVSSVTKTASAISSVSLVYLDKAGHLHKKQTNGRSVSTEEDLERRAVADLIRQCFKGKRSAYGEIRQEFDQLQAAKGKNSATAHGQTDGILRALQTQGATFRMLQAGFKIGVQRYKRIAAGEARQVPGGKNSKAVGDSGQATLAAFVRQLPQEIGFPCGHRRQMSYFTSPADRPTITTMTALFKELYVPWVQASGGTKMMKESTFYEYMAKAQPHFRMQRLEEDACDTCIELKTKLLDKSLDAEERALIEKALENHGALARTLRGAMKTAIVLWAQQKLSGDKELAGVMDALDLLAVDVDESPKPPPAHKCKVQFQAEDYAGNFTLPTYGLKRPGKDYYASNLLLYCFVQSDMSTGINRAIMYDERGMGKGADALCSLRLQLHLKQQVGFRAMPDADRPVRLFQIMDNNVGQNKSQLVMKFFAMLSLTWYPGGVNLLFLLPGHSHMACDRVVGWMRKAVSKQNHYHPSQIVAAVNGVQNVEASFLDHNDPLASLMLCNWDTILDGHLTTIPYVQSMGGYTKG